MGITNDAISVRHVKKSYRSGRRETVVLHDVGFHIPVGSFSVITGPSGSGKSTLLRLLGGLDRPSSGSIEIFGQDITALSDSKASQYRNQTIGFIFQDYRLIPHYSALENVMVPLKIAGLSRREQKQRGQAALVSVGLGKHAGQRVDQLSGGQQQRVCIARAIVTNPKLLIADEPTGNLDSATGKSILQLLRAIQAKRGTTVLMVTHDSSIARLGKPLLSLRDGVLENQS